MAAAYVARAGRLAPLVRPLPRHLLPPPDSLQLELQRSLLYGDASALWDGKPQHYFESMHYGERALSDDEYDSDSLAP